MAQHLSQLNRIILEPNVVIEEPTNAYFYWSGMSKQKLPCHNKYCQVHGTKSSTALGKFKYNFAMNGILNNVVSDNGAQYVSGLGRG